MHESCSLQICQSVLATPCINPNSAINAGLPAQGLPTGPLSAIRHETNHLLLHCSTGPKSKKLQGIKSHVLSLCSHGAKTICSIASALLVPRWWWWVREQAGITGWKELQPLIAGNNLLTTSWLWKRAVRSSPPSWVLWAMPGDGGFWGLTQTEPCNCVYLLVKLPGELYLLQPFGQKQPQPQSRE